MSRPSRTPDEPDPPAPNSAEPSSAGSRSSEPESQALATEQSPAPPDARDAPGPAVPTAAAPHPGARAMPRWNVAELIHAPRFTWRNWFALLGPGLLMGGAAIGGGEWLTGPIVTTRYGGGMLWLATLSILGQVLYNIEISRYTLYTGEPIFTGKFRTLPGPMFWVGIYLLLDFGSIFPYLAANAATPLAAVILGEIPRPGETLAFAVLGMSGTMQHETFLRLLSYAIFLAALVPLVFGGKIYNALKKLMTFKIVVVLGFLTIVAIGWSSAATWREILSGFFEFGNVPVKVAESDPDAASVRVAAEGATDSALKPGKVVNAFGYFFETGRLPDIDWSLIAFLSALVAISGSGGLSNTPISNYTRDQGWGMGHHVGAIPSVVGGQNLQLSHVGTVFLPDENSLPRWKRWYRHVARDQLAVWMPACFLGLALPCMLSVEFLPRGTVADEWTSAAMTADAVRDRVGGGLGAAFWFMVLFCGFLVLAPSMATSADGFIRRWVDVFWTASPRLRRLDPKNIRYVYFGVLVVYASFGLFMLSREKPTDLLTIATTIYNFALGISCWHTLAVNVVLLPRELRPNWLVRIGLVLAGAFFLLIASVAAAYKLGWL